MAIKIQNRSWKNADGSISESWRLIIEDYTSGERTSHYPARKDYPKYGFDSEAPLEKAREILKIVQAKNRVERSAEIRARIDKRIRSEALVESAFLPRRLYSNFLQWLKDRRMWDEIPAKTDSHLRCMRAIILEANVEPSVWSARPEKIYNVFRKKKLSISYVEKVLPLLNAYGYFYSKELQKPFYPVSMPQGDVARKIEEANYEARDGKTKASHPILPEMLPALVALPDDQLRWMRASVFFGLRPFEIDNIGLAHKGALWRAMKDEKGLPVLHVYQSKLVRLERARRWKRIPCILPEQAALLAELEKGLPISRPYAKTLHAHLGEGYGLYGGRKGFEKVMRQRGQRFLNISRWLGHTDIKRTERHYREAEAVEYDPVTRS